MPRNSSGLYQLPADTQAIPNEVIESDAYNALIADFGDEITASLPRDGRAGMTGPLKLTSGTSSAPSLQFTAASTTGWYYDPVGGAIVIVVGGVEISRFSASGSSDSPPIGSGMDYWGTTAPPKWLFPYGQAISRTTYAALFAVLGTTYGSGDGSTTFNLPDKRDRASFGKGNMGGSSANRITNQAGGWNGNLLGGAGGAEQHVLDVNQIPSHQHSGTTAAETQPHTHSAAISPTFGNFAAGGSPAVVGFGTGGTGNQSTTHDHTFNTNFIGGGGSHNNLPPGIVCNYIIFAGV